MPPRSYNQYIAPLNVGILRPAFDVYDFDPLDQGTVYLDQLEIYALESLPQDWTPEVVPAFNQWQWSGVITPYHAMGSGISGGLQVISSIAEDRGFGYWWSPLTSIPWTPDKLYRARFTVASNDMQPTLGAVRVASNDFVWTTRLKFYGLTAPTAGGREYPIYFEPASGTHFFLVFEGMDFEADRGGTNTLQAVTVERSNVKW